MALSLTEKAARRQDAKDRLAARAEYEAAMAGGRGLVVPQVAEPATYTVTTLPSAYKRKQAALKAAATRRANAAARKAQG